MKLALRVKKGVEDERVSYIYWSSCIPFVDSERTKLIHRPREVTMLNTPWIDGNYLAIKGLCGNIFIGNKKFTFLATLPENGKLLCARCEAEALARGLPSADALSGHHVHIGKLKAARICCVKGE